MRYVLIVMFFFSASAQAEEWERIIGTEDMYFADSEFKFHLRDQTVLAKILLDGIEGTSMVKLYQFRCRNGKPVKQRTLYSIYFEGRMGTGNRVIMDADGPWIPFIALAFEQFLSISCEIIDED